MKIVINGLSARLGGGQTYLKNLLSHLPDQFDLDIVVYAPISLQLPEDRRIRRALPRWPTENPLLRTLWERFVLPRILVKERAQLLFCPGGIIAARVPADCKTVTMFRNMIPFDPEVLRRIPFGLQKIRNILLRRVMLQSMAHASLTIFISDYARRVIETLTHIPNPVTIPHGINSDFRTHSSTLPRPAWLPASEYLLYVSRFDVYKHQFEVASAFAALPPALTRSYKLLLVGEQDGVLSRQVAELARQHNLEDQILITGPIAYADLPAVYRHATINLFASSCENCPNILLEALGAGRPVLSSDVMPMPEFGADAVGYFSPSNPQSITNALLSLLQDEERRTQLAAAAARRSGDFDWEESSRVTWAHLDGLVKQ
jgi:glycosyltransferase involved in cell wall biosynthesis